MSWRRRVVAAGALFLVPVTACGGPPTHSATSSIARVAASSSAGPTSAPVGAGLLVISSENADGTMSVRLVDRKGRVTAETNFAPPPLPAFSNCADVVQSPVRVANGAVYFADSSGTVHRLTVDGAVSQVTTFPLTTKQQDLSFAVSPDGKQLIAIVLTTPPLHDPPPQTLGDPIFGPGSWSLDLETASLGGTASVALHKNLGIAFPSPTVITGWDQFGPTATLNSKICTQNSLPSLSYTGTLIHLGLDGTHLDHIGGSDCQAWDELADGTVLCGGADWTAFSVRRENGDVMWSYSEGGYLQDARLSPDGSGVASSAGVVYFRDRSQAASFARTGPPDVEILGWADPGRVVTLGYDGRLGLAAPSNPLMIVDLGLTLGTYCLLCTPYGARLIGTLG